MTFMAYFDCFSGCSGDMLLGALLDAGLDFTQLKRVIAGLDIGDYQLSREKVVRSSITATKFNVTLKGEEPEHEPEHHHDHEHDHGHMHSHDHGHPSETTTYPPHQHRRGLNEILGIIESSRLSPSVKTRSSAIFRRLGEVEAGIHGIPLEQVHFHELGAIDTIIDIVGTVYAFEALGIEKACCSSLPAGSGTIATAHGLLPAPAPATLQLLAAAGAPLVPAPPSALPPGEMVTPTGAALITSLASFSQPAMKIQKVGYGAGTRQFPEWPNVVRVWLGEEITSGQSDELALLETNIDDMNPQIYGYLMEKLLAEKAADVWYTTIQMKKNRPGIMLSVLCPASLEEELTKIIMRETTTLGIRSRRVPGHLARWEMKEINSTLGPVHVKVKRFGQEIVSVAPEYAECQKIARERNLPLREVFRILENEAHQFISPKNP
jgi:pyridinium-3,5-bisthiocarboxylic acid mononucleotide nickel chelatase